MLETAILYDEAYFQGLRPDPLLLVSQWRTASCPRFHRREPGPWRTARTPYLREIMDCLSPSSPMERVVFMAGSQLGKTECGLNWLGYIVHQALGPILMVQPTVEMAKPCSVLWWRQARHCGRKPRSRDSGNTSKEFSGGIPRMPAALSSMPVRFLFLDERAPGWRRARREMFGLALPAGIAVRGGRPGRSHRGGNRRRGTRKAGPPRAVGRSHRVWQDLDDPLRKPWPHSRQLPLHIRAVAVDTGGYHTLQAYAFCRARQDQRVWAIKGRGGKTHQCPDRHAADRPQPVIWEYTERASSHEAARHHG